MEPVFLVVGCGSIGRRHLRNLRQLGAGKLLAWDPVEERLAAAVHDSGATPVRSLEAGLGAGVSACLICSPSAFHAEQAIIMAGGSALFIEKPLATTYEDALAVVEAVEARGRVCLVACNLRFHPGLLALKHSLDSGAVGRPLSIRNEFGFYLPDWHPWEDYRSSYSARADLGGGIVLDDSHEIDIVRWLCGDYKHFVARCGRVGDLEIDAEDIATLVGRTSRGVWCEIHMDYLQRVYSRSCKIVGTEGSLIWDYSAGHTVLLRPNTAPEVICDFENLDSNEMYLSQLRHFLRCLAGEETPAQDARAAAEVVRITKQFQSLKS
jgi:predicted dehydrogenase